MSTLPLLVCSISRPTILGKIWKVIQLNRSIFVCIEKGHKYNSVTFHQWPVQWLEWCLWGLILANFTCKWLIQADMSGHFYLHSLDTWVATLTAFRSAQSGDWRPFDWFSVHSEVIQALWHGALSCCPCHIQSQLNYLSSPFWCSGLDHAQTLTWYNVTGQLDIWVWSKKNPKRPPVRFYH